MVSPKLKKTMKIAVICLLSLILVSLVIVFSLDLFVKAKGGRHITAADDIDTSTPYDCILVLGAGIRAGRPSDMLEDRLLTAIDLYFDGAAPKILVSGDHGSEDYDEVNVMKSFAIEKGVPSEDVFMDHAGFSTYESMYRVKEIFGAKKIIVVTQEYHLYRSLYIANSLGLEAVGVDSALRDYVGDLMRECREIAARNKDFFMCVFKPLPTYMGDTFSLTDNGNVTNYK